MQVSHRRSPKPLESDRMPKHHLLQPSQNSMHTNILQSTEEKKKKEERNFVPGTMKTKVKNSSVKGNVRNKINKKRKGKDKKNSQRYVAPIVITNRATQLFSCNNM